MELLLLFLGNVRTQLKQNRKLRMHLFFCEQHLGFAKKVTDKYNTMLILTELFIQTSIKLHVSKDIKNENGWQRVLI